MDANVRPNVNEDVTGSDQPSEITEVTTLIAPGEEQRALHVIAQIEVK